MRYLVDTSVLGRAHQQRVGDRLEELAITGRLWTCGLIDLEVVYASRAREVAEVIEERRALPEAPITPQVLRRAVQVAGEMASAGHHRGAKPVDLVIAAAAEAAGLAVLQLRRRLRPHRVHHPSSDGLGRTRRKSGSLRTSRPTEGGPSITSGARLITT